MKELLSNAVLLGVGLLLCSVLIHTLVIGRLYRWYAGLDSTRQLSYRGGVWLLLRVALVIVLTHLVEIAIWALAYELLGALPDFNQAFYFSGITYTTVGYGDVVLPFAWKEMAAFEGLTGILMAGWSTAFLFAVLNMMLMGGASVRGGPGRPLP